MRKSMLLCLVALALPLASRAQSPAPGQELPPRFFVGIGANLGRYYTQTDFVSDAALVSPTVLAGAYLTPRLALQANALTCQRQSSYFYQSRDYSAGPSAPRTYYSTSTMRQRTTIVPIVVRYSLSSNPARRLQPDMSLGVTVYHTRIRSSSVTTDSASALTNTYNSKQSLFERDFVLGAGLRYALTPHLELAGEGRSNLDYFGYGLAMNFNAEVSLRYRFGTMKSKADW